jgi:hypothetical protein
MKWDSSTDKDPVKPTLGLDKGNARTQSQPDEGDIWASFCVNKGDPQVGFYADKDIADQ